VHHSWIAGFLMVASSSHFAISFISDSRMQSQALFKRIFAHKSASLSALSGCCLWLGFHTLAVYSHNDTCVAFGEPEKQILIEPTNAQIIQQSIGKALYFTDNPSLNNDNVGLTVDRINKSFGSFLLPLGPGDMLVHHAIALGLHVSILTLSKGALHATVSNLMPDKMDVHYATPCDGPARGGTCDISAWDSFYLAMFWMLNSIGWITFYFHWKNLTLWENTPSLFDQSSTYLNAWFRDYLWSHSAPLIRGYDAFGVNDLSVSAWAFLGAHLCWATGFMFLISWRGYCLRKRY
jgi:photosystem I P700 chlorophyll a apoprotein A2